MKVVVTGASGMLGSAVVRELQARDHEVDGWSLATPRLPDGTPLEMLPFDLDVRATKRLWQSGPDLVVNCAAVTDADACETRRAVAERLNAYFPARLARRARANGTRLVQVSTDAVYDGDRPGLRREDETLNPLSIYAKTKREGERWVLRDYPDALVVRTNMFGWTLPSARRRKFAEEILGKLSYGEKMTLFEDQVFSPLHVADLASAILDLADMPVAEVINVGSRFPVTKATFGRMIAEAFEFDSSLIVDGSVNDARLTAPRPKNVGLDVSRATFWLGEMPTVEEGIARLRRDVYDGTAIAIRGRETYP